MALNLWNFTLARKGVHRHRRRLAWLLSLAALLILSGCGLFASSPSGPDVTAIRTPKPTFTPTAAAQVAAQPAPVVDASPAVASTDATTAEPTPTPRIIAVVTGPLVNLRRGPGTEFDIVAAVERGAEYAIVGKNRAGDWWEVCCVDGAQAWVIGEFVDTDGPVDSVPITDGSSAPAPVAAAPAQAAPAASTPAPAPVAMFDLRTQEQFPETAGVRLFMYVYAGEQGLAGYSVRVTKDGAELPVAATSFAGQPAFTWPFQDARQRYQNFKVEFPDVPPAGVWQVQLIDESGATVGPATTFTLIANDPEQELYVRYERR